MGEDPKSDLANFSFYCAGLYSEFLTSSKDADMATDVLNLHKSVLKQRASEPETLAIEDRFNTAIKGVNRNFAEQTRDNEIKKKEFADGIIATIAIATLLYSAASAISAANAASAGSYSYSSNVYLPSSSTLYYVRPLSPSTLYLLPLN